MMQAKASLFMPLRKLFSSRPTNVISSPSRLARPRSTAVFMISCVCHQLRRRSCLASLMLRAAFRTSIANASNRSVKCELFDAHGSSMTFTLWSAHFTRGVFAWISVSNCIVSRCRQTRSGCWS